MSGERVGAVSSAGHSPVGHSLHEIVTATLRQATALRPLLDESSALALDDMVKYTEAQICRIAVIGQVKAGKSCLINALIRRPHFLPTDVNPWTAVVTNLHFGVPSDAGAVYQFFDELDWARLGSGGRLHELSRRLGVTLDADTLSRQIQLMRDRAELRLGSEFRQLLGQQHRFAAASAEVLERYVCAGDLDRGAAAGIRPGHSVGRFADITKSADLYFDLAPFARPTLIMDTPGTNDPFLVRDQLSRDALDRVDVCIVVLNAQQALSSSDVGLLRLLHGLQKDRIVVFVNRIDLLADPEVEARAVLAHVRGKLAIEFPGSEIPVIVGSAMWAELALVPPAAVARLGREAIRVPLDLPEERAELMRRAGLEDLSRLISQLINDGPTLLRLRRTQNALLEMVSKVDLAMRDEIRSLDQHIAATREDSASIARRRAQMASDFKRLEVIPPAVARQVNIAVKEINLAKNMALRKLAAALRGIVRDEAEAARKALLQRPFSRNEHAWRYNTSRIRRDLEDRFLTIYREAAAELQKLERTINAWVLGAIKGLVPKDAIVIEQLPVNLIDPAPSIGALGWQVALELDEQWQAWWRLWHGQKQRARKLEELLGTEFQRAVEALIETATVELDDHVTAVSHRFSKLNQDLVVILKRRKAEIEAERRDPEAGKSTALLQTYHERRSDLEKDVNHCVRIATELTNLASRSMAIGDPPPEEVLESSVRPLAPTS